ncbi:MAG: hypothetical protein OEZ13_09705 [Spirochaetia bacterium]|nr:hypothetical protein [Spirochaetia bacterium]
MKIEKKDNEWLALIEDEDNQLGLINTIRRLEKLNNEIDEDVKEPVILSIDLQRLQAVNSELVAQFVMLQSNLVRTNGRLQIINTNPELKSSFDVVMLDKIISIEYFGKNNSSSDTAEEPEDDDFDDDLDDDFSEE